MVELYWVRSEVLYDFISRYRSQNMALLGTIKVVKHNYTNTKLKAFYKSKGLNPFLLSTCNTDESIKQNDEIRRSYLIGNLSNKDITLRMVNDDKVGGVYTLKPYELRYSRPEYAGLDGDYTVIAEQIDQEGNCINKFVAVNKGYLLIE